MISLGCPKNLVDSETILGVLAGAGYVVTSALEEAEIVLVNTCGFIKPAVREALETINRCIQLKKKRKLPNPDRLRLSHRPLWCRAVGKIVTRGRWVAWG